MEQELTVSDDCMQLLESSHTTPLLRLDETTEMPHPRGRHKHVSSVALLVRDPLAIKVRSDMLTTRILLGLLNKAHFSKNPARNLVEYIQSLPKGKGFVSIALSPHKEESWDHVIASLHLLGDELVDTFLVLLAVALDTHETRRITAPFEITPDDILAICQKKKSKGSYTARQRQCVLEQVQTLARTSVFAKLTLRRGEPHMVESPLLEVMMDEPIEGNGTGIEHNSGRSWRLKIGDWAIMVPELQSQTTMLARQVLRYHAREQKHEKRLGRYLTMLYRINAYKNKGRVKVSMGVLLEQAGIDLDHDNPGRTRDAVESALKRLCADDVIGPFALLAEDSVRSREIQERIRQHAYHWWDDYRRQIWLFEPPEYLRALNNE